jgi:uncharacterized Tic20 family protein
MASVDAHASHDERLLSAACHSSSLLPIFGFVVPLHIWLTQRDWSRFVQFHALQALLYQMAGPPLIGIVFWLIFAGVFGGFPGGFALRCVLALLFVAAWMLYILWGILGARRVLSGRDFFYPLLGKWVARKLSGQKAEANRKQGA